MINCIICNVQKISRQMYLTIFKKIFIVYRFSTKLDDGIEDDDDDSSVEKV